MIGYVALGFCCPVAWTVDHSGSFRTVHDMYLRRTEFFFRELKALKHCGSAPNRLGIRMYTSNIFSGFIFQRELRMNNREIYMVGILPSLGTG